MLIAELLQAYRGKNGFFKKNRYVYFIAGGRHEGEDQQRGRCIIEWVADEIPSELGDEANVRRAKASASAKRTAKARKAIAKRTAS
jgi:hypothetical protein